MSQWGEMPRATDETLANAGTIWRQRGCPESFFVVFPDAPGASVMYVETEDGIGKARAFAASLSCGSTGIRRVPGGDWNWYIYRWDEQKRETLARLTADEVVQITLAPRSPSHGLSRESLAALGVELRGEGVYAAVLRNGTWTGYDYDAYKQAASADGVEMLACGLNWRRCSPSDDGSPQWFVFSDDDMAVIRGQRPSVEELRAVGEVWRQADSCKFFFYSIVAIAAGRWSPRQMFHDCTYYERANDGWIRTAWNGASWVGQALLADEVAVLEGRDAPPVEPNEPTVAPEPAPVETKSEPAPVETEADALRRELATPPEGLTLEQWHAYVAYRSEFASGGHCGCKGPRSFTASMVASLRASVHCCGNFTSAVPERILTNDSRPRQLERSTKPKREWWK